MAAPIRATEANRPPAAWSAVDTGDLHVDIDETGVSQVGATLAFLERPTETAGPGIHAGADSRWQGALDNHVGIGRADH